MSWTIPFALYAWIPLVAIAFIAFEPARAALLCYLAGWMFLPEPGIEISGFDWNKTTAVPLAVFLAIVVFDGARLARFRASLVDLPIALFCLAPLASSLSNDLGWYDAISGVAYQTISWGLPWLTGRLYFTSPAGLRQLAVGMLGAGLIYAPLCLWEIRMSPQLHAWLYGIHQHEWLQTIRGGGYRPMVFMQHGLMVGLWMSAASITGLVLWTSGAMRRIGGIPLSLAVPALIATTLLGKSFGAIALLLAGAMVLLLIRIGRTSLPMAVLICIPTVYVGIRVSGAWAGEEAVGLVREISSDRAHSLEIRLESEEKLRVKAGERPLLGWGGWGRSLTRLSDDPLRKETVTIDSLWIIVFGKFGVVGLGSLLLALLLPVLALWRRCPPSTWSRPASAWPWALALVLTLYALDDLVNAMVNPVYLLMAGGLGGLAPAPLPARRRARIALPTAAPVVAQRIAR